MTGRLAVLVRRAALAGGVVAAAGVALAPAAAADVTVTSPEAVQGDAASVTFQVRNDRPGTFTTRLEVDLPADRPVSEVYPMTNPDWAPKIVQRPVTRGLPGIHADGLTTATSAIVWERAADAPRAPATETLRLEMGPMPAVDSFAFTVVQTYSDGTVRRFPTSTTALALARPVSPAPGAQGHAGHGEGVAPTAVATVAAAPAKSAGNTRSAGDAESAGSTTEFTMFVAGVGVALTAVGLVGFPVRRRAQGDADSGPTSATEAGAEAGDEAGDEAGAEAGAEASGAPSNAGAPTPVG